MKVIKGLKMQDFLIDKITNSIEDAVSGKSLATDILPANKADLKTVLKKNGWRFNWKIEINNKERQVYKLVTESDGILQGLISLQAIENFIEMHLIETAPHNFGKGEKFMGVAGNLVAFACKLSFESGFNGYVAFTSKTELIAENMSYLQYLSHPDFNSTIKWSALDDGNMIATGIDVYAYGLRNPFGLMLHLNGNLYGTDNGTFL